MLVVLTHDVDWGRRGPPYTHVLERLGRYDPNDKLTFFTLRDNLYNGIPLLMEYEERVGAKSTFFFRPVYDDETTVELYSDIISELRRGGWEVGLHANSGHSLDLIAYEKSLVERVYSEPVVSLRVHYLRIDSDMIPKLSSIGIKFDSSTMPYRQALSTANTGCKIIGRVVEVPVTIMDTYMFTYWGVAPEEAYQKLLEALKYLHGEGVSITTILWHSNSARMRGGKAYLRFVEEIWRYEWIRPVRLRDLEGYLSLCRE